MSLHKPRPNPVFGSKLFTLVAWLGVLLGQESWAVASTNNFIIDWNDALLSAIRDDNTAAPLAARDLAILHAAIFDAVNSIQRKREKYLTLAVTEGETSMEAAVCAAGHRIAINLFPANRGQFDKLRETGLAMLKESEACDRGVQLGVQVADHILTARIADGAIITQPYIPSAEPGQWRRTPPFYRPPELPQWGHVTPFVLTNIAQFRPPGPPALTSEQYAIDLNEVKTLGRQESRERTAEQTLIAQFWSDFSHTVTPPGHWNQIAQNVATNAGLGLEDTARLFALLNFALADAGIVVWDCKYEHNFWRPVTAIQQASRDNNPQTEEEAEWQPLLNTPPFPEYVSGHSGFSGAAAAVLRRFCGTDSVKFTVGSDTLPAVKRTYSSFSEAAAEIGRSRIYGGIHFSSANRDGLAAGKKIGEFVMDHCLLPAKADNQ